MVGGHEPPIPRAAAIDALVKELLGGGLHAEVRGARPCLGNGLEGLGRQPRAPVVGGQDLRHGLWCWLWHLQWCFLRRDLWCLGLVLAPLVQLLSHPFQRDGELL